MGGAGGGLFGVQDLTVERTEAYLAVWSEVRTVGGGGFDVEEGATKGVFRIVDVEGLSGFWGLEELPSGEVVFGLEPEGG